MHVSEIHDRREWEGLRPVWNTLLDRSGSGTTFLTWEWLNAWWSAYGNERDLRLLIATDESGTIRGIAPLRRQTVRRFGRSFPALAFIGDGSSDSDYLDFIVARGFEQPVVEAWVRHLHADMARGVILQLHEMPAASPNLKALKLCVPNYLWAEQAVPCGTVKLPSDWNEYVGSLRPRFRTKIRSVLRMLEGRQDVRFGFCQHESDLDRLLPALFDLHTRRWNHDGLPGVFGWDRKRRFYAELSPLLLKRDALRLSWLEWQGRILACQYGFVHGGAYLHLQEGYEPAAEHWNIGIGLRAWSIREMINSGVREYDFLAGIGRHKSDWGAEVKESRRIDVGAGTYGNVLFFRGPEWQRRAKDAVKRVVPARVLNNRDALARRRNGAPPSTLRRQEFLRRTAAKCYFNLGGPAAARLVRARYQASVSDEGKLIRGSWAKRRQPAGRILYYHRVNNDNDPFFPSLPLDVFDRQMRYLSRHYRVVSLGGLLDHLAGGSCDSVVAITFDDGYRDNFDNAFPILERYGLPATIFLTTGSVDSREPLWFEVLADAVKQTALEYLDVEVDLPRRFWLRTREERLTANDQLFGLLRQMPDEERQQHFPQFLRALGCPATGPRTDQMLTWEQIRHMKQHGIDFGGHTVTHPYLSRLSRERMQWEVSECKHRIEAELQAPVVHFAYPNGREGDFSAWNKELIRSAGYEAAVTTLWGLNYESTDRLELRRGQAWEQDEALFAYKMDWYQLVNG